ncbi:MAG: 3'(2'),5'-bisphosphate nucleotidase CysQ [Lewinellaceae bacterium]|nr:3'(2'),5'-bisphosphate nucleotidase CysQ [Lewinellaceae bacterium]
MNRKELAEEAIQIARRAGGAIMAIYGKEDFGVELKQDESPLTLADMAANRLICEALEQLPVRYPIVSEENKAIPCEERRKFEYNWLVDPLDGTKEFIKRNGEFTVNIALIHNGAPVLGVVHVPCLGETYWAVKGEGAYWERNGETQPIRAASFRLSDPGLHVVCSRSHLNADTQAFIGRLQAPELVARGSSLKFLILARGEAHLYPRLGPTMEWDTAAAQAILEEAGGMVIDEETKQPLRYNKENLRNPYFIAYGKVQ